MGLFRKDKTCIIAKFHKTDLDICSWAALHSRYGTWLVSQRFLVRYPVWPHTSVSPSADSRGAVVSYWQKYVHEVLVNHLWGLSLPRKSVVRLTDCPDMTLDVYCGRKTTQQQDICSHSKEGKSSSYSWINTEYKVNGCTVVFVLFLPMEIIYMTFSLLFHSPANNY